MRSLSPEDDALFAKLVELADGRIDIVNRVLTPGARARVSLTEIVKEISALRESERSDTKQLAARRAA
jgi:hypothetical protein